MTFNIDTIFSTLVAGAIVLILGLILRARLAKPDTDHVPSRLQMIWEGVVGEVNDRSRTTSAACTPTSRRWRSRCSSSS